MPTYQYTVEGLAADDQTWTTKGTVEASIGDFGFLMRPIMSESFDQLTKGRAQFGKPGVGCRGPYSITRLEIVVKPQ